MSDHVSKNSVAHDGGAEASPESSNPDRTRRSFFKIASIVLGLIVGIGPALIGLVAFLDPLRRTPARPISHVGHASRDARSMIRVASVDALSVDAPQRFLVIDDQIDAWNFTPDQPIGAVYIEKLKDGSLRVFNTTCPHAGCSVACIGNEYLCPCHNSSFGLDGSKLVDGGRENPSPRDLDSLPYEVREDNSIWVEFKNFYTGKPEKKAKA
ncbi:MAG: Rieske (2Fe-2S) protein [Planctomycetota bacterium]